MQTLRKLIYIAFASFSLLSFLSFNLKSTIVAAENSYKILKDPLFELKDSSTGEIIDYKTSVITGQTYAYYLSLKDKLVTMHVYKLHKKNPNMHTKITSFQLMKFASEPDFSDIQYLQNSMTTLEGNENTLFFAYVNWKTNTNTFERSISIGKINVFTKKFIKSQPFPFLNEETEFRSPIFRQIHLAFTSGNVYAIAKVEDFTNYGPGNYYPEVKVFEVVTNKKLQKISSKAHPFPTILDSYGDNVATYMYFDKVVYKPEQKQIYVCGIAIKAGENNADLPYIIRYTGDYSNPKVINLYDLLPGKNYESATGRDSFDCTVPTALNEVWVYNNYFDNDADDLLLRAKVYKVNIDTNKILKEVDVSNLIEYTTGGDVVHRSYFNNDLIVGEDGNIYLTKSYENNVEETNEFVGTNFVFAKLDLATNKFVELYKSDASWPYEVHRVARVYSNGRALINFKCLGYGEFNGVVGCDTGKIYKSVLLAPIL